MKIALFILILLSLDIYAQKSTPDTAVAFFYSGDIKLDGILDEDIWSKVPKISNFHQRETNEGSFITEKTELSIIYNNEKLWIGVWCWDSEPDKIIRKEMKRDFYYWRDDNFEVIFDTYLDKRNGYVFVVNPNGAMADVQITNEGQGFNRDWNAVWDAKTIITNQGWCIEIEIPFSSLKFPDKEEQIWGVNFERNIRRKQEQAFWQGWSRNYDFEHVSHAGTLIGLRGIASKETLELKPFLSGGLQFKNESELKKLGKIGGDANLFITPSVKMNLTINTDFAQVESDQLEYNLSRFNLFYPEKRDFFIEAKDFFQFNIDDNARAYYSRKIGISNDGNEMPILAGIKVTGIENRTNIGIMSIQNDAVADNSTFNNTVIRIKQGIWEKSSLGLILTNYNNKNINSFLYGIDFNYATSKLFGDKNFSIRGFLSESFATERNNNNYAYSITTDYRNDIINTGLQFSNVLSNYSPEIGFLRRNNYKLVNYDFKYKFRTNDLPLLQYIQISPINTNIYFTDNTNQLESISYKFVPISLLTKNGDNISYIFNREFDRVDDTIPSLYLSKNKYWFGYHGIELSTFEGRFWYAYLLFNKGTYYNGNGQEINTSLRLNLTHKLGLSFNYSNVNLKFSNYQIIKEYSNIHIEYGFNPKLFTSFYLQWLSLTKQIVLNYRLHWVPVSGSDFYFVVNQNFKSDSNILLQNTTFLAKFIWRIPVSI